MILPFSTKLNGVPTLFPEKILSGMLKEYENKENQSFKEVPDFIYNYGEFAGYYSADCILEIVDQSKPKLHTIREDKNDRWQPGVKIDFFIYNRTKDMFRFAPVLSVVSIQEIEIIHYEDNEVLIHGVPKKKKIIIDNKRHLEESEILQLAHNDGFDSIDDFFEYFKEDFTGKIIHWTTFKY